MKFLNQVPLNVNSNIIYILFKPNVVNLILVVTSTIMEKPKDPDIQNTLETNITEEGKLVEQPADTFDSFFKDFEVEEHENDKCNPSTAESLVQQTVQPSVQSQNTKQSLFMRLANRIKVIYS